eukprot:gene10884-13334_t
MVSTLAVSVLSKYLGEYLDDLNKDNIKLSFLSGDAELKDVKIKKTALQKLFPNVIVKQAIVSKLSLHIPWNNLKGKPAIIKLEGIYVLAESQKEFDEQYYRKKFQDEKQAKLLIQEMMRSKLKQAANSILNSNSNNNNNNNINTNENEEPSTSSTTSFGSKLITTVIDNLQLYIESVHIRFEDEVSKKPFSVGVTLKKLFVESTDSDWKPTFIKNETTVIHKTIDLDNFSIYWNSNSTRLEYQSIHDLSEKLKLMIKSKEELNSPTTSSFQYILPPITAKLKGILNKSMIPMETIPKYSLNFEVGATEFCLSDNQYQDITMLLESFSLFKKSIEFRAKRPSKSISDDPKAWWNYAITSIRSRVHTDRYRHSWSFIFEFLHDKKEYIKLFKKSRRNTIHPTEQVRLDALEWKLSFEHISLFRKLSYRAIEKEDKKQFEILKSTTKQQPIVNSNSPKLSSQQQQQQAGGWFSSWWNKSLPTPNSPSLTSTSTTTTNKDEIILSKEDWNEIYDTIGYEEENNNNNNLITSRTDFSDFVHTIINFKLEQGIIRLNRKEKPMALLKLDHVNMSLRSKSNSFTFSGDLGAMELLDHSTRGTQFPKLISPWQKDNYSNPIFKINFESFKPGSPVNYGLEIKSRPITIVYYPIFIQTITNFFMVNSTSIDVFEDLGKMAQDTVKNIKSTTYETLLLAISNRMTLSLALELEAPIIVVPDQISDPNTNLIVLDLGQLSINHNPTTIIKKQQQQISNDYLEEFYDEYLFKLKNIQVLLANQTQDWRNPAQVKIHRMNIANPFNAQFNLKISKLSNQILTSLKLNASIDLLEFYLSSSQYVDFVNVVQSALASNQSSPSFETIGDDESTTITIEKLLKEEDSGISKEIIENYRMIEASFQIENFNVHLRMESEEGKLVQYPLAMAYLRKIQGKYEQRMYDTKLEFKVMGLWIEDCLQKEPGNGHYLAFSNSKISLTDPIPDNESNFILLSLTQVSPDSPNYQGTDKLWDFEFTQMNMVLNKNTVAGVIEFLNSVHSITIKRQKDRYNNNNSQINTPSKPNNNNNNYNSSGVDNIIQIRTRLKIDFVRILLSKENNTPLVKVSLTDFYCVTDNYLLTTIVNGKLGTFKIYDMTLEGRNYRTILTTKERKVLNFNQQQQQQVNSSSPSPSPAPSSSPSSTSTSTSSSSSSSMINFSQNIPFGSQTDDSSLFQFKFESKQDGTQYLKVNLSSIRFVFLKRFVEEIRLFLNHVNIMREYLKSSIYSAATVISQNRTTLLYEIEIQNPYIIVPLSSLSNQIFIVDLGNILIRNHFEPHDYQPPQKQPTTKVEDDILGEDEIENFTNNRNRDELLLSTTSTNQLSSSSDSSTSYHSQLDDQEQLDPKIIIENIHIDANNIKVLSGLNTDFQKTPSSRKYGAMVKDVNFSLHLKTPILLDSSTYTKKQLRMIRMPPWYRNLNISQFELNISELESSCLIELLDGNLSEFSSEIVQQEPSLIITEQQDSSTIEPPPTTKHEDEEEEEEEMEEELLQVGISNCELGKFSIGFMRNDGSNEKDRLVLFMVHDTKMKIVNQPMETTILVEINHIKMKDFNQTTHPHFRNLLSPLSLDINTDDQQEFNFTEPQVVITGSIKPPPIQQNVIHVKINKLNAIFVPHSWINVQDCISRLTTLSMEAWARYSVKVYGAPPPSDELIQSGSSLYGLSIGDIKISLPGDTRTQGKGSQEHALIIKAGFEMQITTKGATGVETISLIEGNNIQVYRNRMNSPDISNSTSSASSTSSEEFPNETPIVNRQETVQIQKYFSFTLDKGTFDLINDHNVVETLPLLSINVTKLKNNIFTWSLKNQIALSMEANTEATYYNNNSGVWEPLIEPWGFTLTCNNSVEGGWMVDFSSKYPLLINITKGFVDTSISTYQIWADDYYKKDNQQQPQQQIIIVDQQQASQQKSIKNQIAHPYYIKNDTGQKLWYWMDNEDLKEIPINAEIPLESAAIKRQQKQGAIFDTRDKTKGIEIEKKISFQLYGNFKPIKNVPIDSIGTYTLCPMPEYRQIKLLYDISYRKGSKILSLHSSIVMENQTDFPVLAYIHVVSNRELAPVEIQLNPHSSIPLPVIFTLGRIRFKPYNLGYNFSTEQIDCFNIIKMIKTSTKQKQNNDIINNNNNNNNNNNILGGGVSNNSVYARMVCTHGSKLPFVFNACIEKDFIKKSNKISVLPPIIIENVLACDFNYRIYHAKNKKMIGSPFTSGCLQTGNKLPLLVFDQTLDIYMEIQIYDFPWSVPILIETAVKSSLTEKIKVFDQSERPLLISFDNRIQNDGSRFVTVYCEYWMINQTGLPLYFRHHIGAQTIDPAIEGGGGSNIQLRNSNNSTRNNIKSRDSRLWYNKEWAHPSKPFMFAYNDLNIIGGRFSMKIADSKWSTPFNLNSQAASNSNIQISEEKTPEEKEIKNLTKKMAPKTQYQLSVNILPSNSKFWRTKVVTFSPMYLIVNTSPYVVIYQQFECESHSQSILPDQSLPFHFPSSKNEKLIRVGLLSNDVLASGSGGSNDEITSMIDIKNPNIKWSGFFNPKQLGQCVLCLKTESEYINAFNDKKDSETPTKRNQGLNSSSNQLATTTTTTSNEEKTFLSVTVRVRSTKTITTTMIILNEQNPELPPYKIDNKSKYPLWIKQKKTEVWEKINPSSCVPYSWDHPILPKKLVIEFPGNEKGNYNLENLEEYSIVSFKDNNSQKIELEVYVIANGPTRVLVINEKLEKSSKSKRDHGTALTSGGTSSSSSSNPDYDDLNKYETRIFISKIGISIVNQVPEEIIYITIDGLKLEFKQSKTDQYIQFVLHDLQIDDQRYQTNFPVFLCQTKKIKNSTTTTTTTTTTNSNNNNNSSSTNSSIPFFQFSATRSLKYSNIIFFRYFSFLIQEFDLNIDEASVLNALSFININLNSLNDHFTLHPTITQDEILQTKNASNIQNHMIYFELLHINPLKVNLSFISCKSPKETQAILGARSLAELLIGFKSNSPFLNIERAPISFNGFIWKHPFLSTKEAINEITLHFSYQMMGQAHKIFGSFDFIGNPIRLAEYLGSGFKDFFHEPALGIVKSPQDFALGLSKGTSSLVNNTVFGFCDSASKITGTISKGLVHLSLDDNYIKERQESNKQKPQGLTQGIGFGIRDLGEGILKGITGIIEEPIKGATQEKSWEGFFKGVGKGVIGAAVKPTVGVFEFASKTSEGIRNATTIAKSMVYTKRRRVPRYFPKDGTLQIYNQFRSVGAYILYSKIGPPPRDWYVFHCLLGKEYILVSSNAQLLLLQPNKSSGSLVENGGKTNEYDVVWKLKISDILEYTKSSSSFAITITFATSRDIPPSTVIIPTPSEEIRMAILRKMKEIQVFRLYSNG